MYDTKRHYACNIIQQYTRLYNTIIIRLYGTIRHHTTLYKTIRQYIRLYDTVRHYTTTQRYTRLYDTMQDYTTLYYIIDDYYTRLYRLNNTIQRYTRLYDTICHFDVFLRGWVNSYIPCACEQSLNIKSSIIFTFFFVNHKKTVNINLLLISKHCQHLILIIGWNVPAKRTWLKRTC
jgi:hypothetical protein